MAASAVLARDLWLSSNAYIQCLHFSYCSILKQFLQSSYTSYNSVLFLNTFFSKMNLLVRQGSTNECALCQQNASILKKYEQIFHLYNADKELSSILSNGKITNDTETTASGTEYRSQKLISSLKTLFYKACIPFFILAKKPSVKKCILLSLSNKMIKSFKQLAFNKILTISKSKQKYNPNQQLIFMNKNSQSQASESLIRDNMLLKKDDCLIAVEESLKNLNTNLKQPNNTQQRVKREQQIINEKLKLQNKFLWDSLRELIRRQERQNLRKQESLLIFGEELKHKNQTIQNLLTMVENYESKQEVKGKVLEDDLFSLKKELTNLEKVRDKLQNQLFKSKNQAKMNQLKIQSLESQIEEKEANEKRERQQAFKWELNKKILEKQKQNYHEIRSIFSRKLKRMSIYEKQLENELSKITNNSIKQNKSQLLNLLTEQQNSKFNNSFKKVNFLSQTKIDFIFSFLLNIDQPGYDLKDASIFQDEELKVLMDHKSMYLTMKNERDLSDNIRIEQKNSMGHNAQFRGILSAFSEFESPKDENEDKIIENNRSGKEMKANIKMLELELEKKKGIQKISQLKQKIMHIRQIVLNFLKNVEQPSLNPEAKEVLEVVFDIFQYSQEERESMFVKKKKRFSFF